MTTLQGKGEVVDSAVDSIAEEKVRKGIPTPQIKREAIGREVASTGEEEEDEEAEVVVEEVVVDLVRAAAAAAAVVVVVVVASAGSENSKDEVAAIARESVIFRITSYSP